MSDYHNLSMTDSLLRQILDELQAWRLDAEAKPCRGPDQQAPQVGEPDDLHCTKAEKELLERAAAYYGAKWDEEIGRAHV